MNITQILAFIGSFQAVLENVTKLEKRFKKLEKAAGSGNVVEINERLEKLKKSIVSLQSALEGVSEFLDVTLELNDGKND